MIDITPTWKGLLPLFLTALEIGTDEGKRAAKEELVRMAEAADAYNTPPPQHKKKPDWRDPFCKRRDENVLSNVRDAYFYGFEDAIEIIQKNPPTMKRD
jgi:hypothetical protein